MDVIAEDTNNQSKLLCLLEYLLEYSVERLSNKQ